MKLCIWRTGHQIADTVAGALAKGFKARVSHVDDNDQYGYEEIDAHIAYGILRGTDEVFAMAEDWFELDNGYFSPGHFDGYYRISYKGTQAKWHDDIPQQDIDFKLEDWKIDRPKWVLVCPPTEPVKQFFGVDWVPTLKDASTGYKYIWRDKNMTSPINWDEICGAITFNSSVGWQALQRGIPVYSDPDHSIIGSYYKAKMQNPIDFLSDEYRSIDREPLFRAMAAHQFKLSEISEGKAWPIINHYLKRQESGNGK